MKHFPLVSEPPRTRGETSGGILQGYQLMDHVLESYEKIEVSVPKFFYIGSWRAPNLTRTVFGHTRDIIQLV